MKRKRSTAKKIRRSYFFLSILLIFGAIVPLSYAHYFSSDGRSSLVMKFEPPIAGWDTPLTFTLQDERYSYVTDPDVVHERKLHVFIIGEDLKTFAHIHPEDFPEGLENQVSGRYVVNYTFPKGGSYLAMIDFTTNGKNYLQTFPMFVQPNRMNNQTLGTHDKDFSRTKSFGDYEVTLNLPERILPNATTDGSFTIGKNGVNVTDLEMYLGSEAHIEIADEGLIIGDHTHAFRPAHSLHVGKMVQRYSGPTVPFQLNFPQPGTYAVFGQFQHEGKVVNVQFLVKVSPDLPFNGNPWALGAFAIILFSILLYAGLLLEKKFRTKRPKPIKPLSAYKPHKRVIVIPDKVITTAMIGYPIVSIAGGIFFFLRSGLTGLFIWVMVCFAVLFFAFYLIARLTAGNR